MKLKAKKLVILGIETSCDDTAIALIEANGDLKSLQFNILKNEISSQIKIHKEYGGIVPGLAKREHARNLIPVLLRVLKTDSARRGSGLPVRALDLEDLTPLSGGVLSLSKDEAVRTSKMSSKKLEYQNKHIESLLSRYPEMLNEFKKKIIPFKKPDINLIAVTHGPGLEPALWVGINFARALSLLWNIPLIGVDHMEGHIAAILLEDSNCNNREQASAGKVITFPALALAVSGGHTQLILIKNWLNYKLLGETLDDAAGEAFDKIARLLGLPFPGGPEIQKIAKRGNENAFSFPRPMLHSNNFNFSFSGLKTSVLYKVQELTKNQKVFARGISNKNIGKNLSNDVKSDIAASFQQAVIDTLVKKTLNAAKKYNVKTIMLAGGVAANEELRKKLKSDFNQELPKVTLLFPSIKLATDNAAMIAVAGYLNYINGSISNWKTLKANSNKLITDQP